MGRNPAFAAIEQALEELDEELSLPLLSTPPLASWDDVRQRLTALAAVITTILLKSNQQLSGNRAKALIVAVDAIRNRDTDKALAMLRRAVR